MTRRLLEINDVALLVADPGGSRVTSPGQIICGEGPRDELRVGRAASERRRINPRATHDRFWAALDQTPLPYPAGPARSNADLVWLHLRELLAGLERADDDTWTVVVPAAYDDGQLALLLGIARSLALRVERLLSAPVVAAAAAAADGHCLVVDAHWHRFSADRVAASGQGFRLDADGVADARASGGRGLGALLDTWAGLVNDTFVRQTRFDPSHDAVVEQGLYNRLPEWLARMAGGEDVVAELDVGEHRYRAELSTAAFIEAAEPFYRVLSEWIGRAAAETLVLRHRLTGLPGLAQRIAEAGHAEPRWLDEHVVVETALGLPAGGAGADDGAVPLMLELSAESSEPAAHDSSSPDERDAGPAASEVPTHVLIDGSALAIDASGRALTGHWRIEREPSGRIVLAGDDVPDRRPARINGRPAEAGAGLEIGDRIAIVVDGDDGEDGNDGKNGEKEFVLLRVADRAGADDSGEEERGSA